MAFLLPHRILVGAVLIAVASAALVLWTTLREPWLGLRLKADADANAVRIVGVNPAAPTQVPLGELVAVTKADGTTAQLTPEPKDVIEDPDLIGTYREVQELFARQSALNDALKHGTVTLTVRDGGGTASTVTVTAGQRPISDLLVSFWVQLITGVGGFLIGAWVLALRPTDLATRLFASSGAMLLLAAHSAAVYSARELAIDGTLFRTLSALNHVGTLGFGVAMITLFLSYPKPLVAPRTLLIIPAIFGTWLALDLTHWAPSPVIGTQLPAVIEMALIVISVGAQWLVNRRDPHARAALRWLGLSVVVGAGAFILLIMAPILVASAPAIEQGHAFGFFLLIYAGIALGIGRYRLFDLDDWAFRVTFYLAGALLLLAIDAALIMLLNLQHEASFGIALLAVGFIYLPLRERLWTRLVARRRMESHELFRAVIDLTLASSATDRAQRWKALLQRLFDPLAIEPAAPPARAVETRNEGLEMALPATADTASLVLRFPWRGRHLFGTAHLQLATHLVQLMQHAENSRNSYERGSQEERRRIARDLHDDVGARLLSGLHKTNVRETHRVLRDAIADIRTVVTGLSDDRAQLTDVVAALRHETGERLEAAGIALDWALSPVDECDVPVDYRVHRNLVSAHREAISNVIRHAEARAVRIELELSETLLRMTIRDDGIGMETARRRDRLDGTGLAGMKRRLAEAGGALALLPVVAGTCLQITIPLGGEAIPGTAQPPALVPQAEASNGHLPPQSRGVAPVAGGLGSRNEVRGA